MWWFRGCPSGALSRPMPRNCHWFRRCNWERGRSLPFPRARRASANPWRSWRVERPSWNGPWRTRPPNSVAAAGKDLRRRRTATQAKAGSSTLAGSAAGGGAGWRCRMERRKASVDPDWSAAAGRRILRNRPSKSRRWDANGDSIAAAAAENQVEKD